MDLANDLKARGLVERASADLEKILGKQRTIYVGVDPTADSMHVGHLVWILLMKRLGQAGHKLIFIVGGGTGMIGDPKEKGERPLLDAPTIRRNLTGLKAQLKSILGRTSFRMVDNADWLLKTNLIDFLREIGKHFTVNDLIKRENIKRRLDTPDESISYTEFTYALLQGFDFLTLYRKYGCDMQVGASDQWTNILSGVDLIRKKEGAEAFAYTIPLVTDQSGKKFGKSEGNAVWLDPKKTPPYDFYQFWLNQPDSVVETYLKFYTFLSLEEIAMLMELHGRDPARREAQQALAREVTKIVHGEKALEQAISQSGVLHAQDRDVEELKKLVNVVVVEHGEEKKIVDVLVESGLFGTKNEARRGIEANGVTRSGEKVTDIHETTASYPPGDYELRFGNRSSILSVEN